MSGIQIQMSTNDSVLSDKDVDRIIVAMKVRMEQLVGEEIFMRKEAAKYMKMGTRNFDRLANEGNIPSHKPQGWKHKVYLKSELIHLVKTS
jgi:hypothetical protein